MAGLHLDPWQQFILEHGLAERTGNLWAAFEVAVLVSRQNGKGSILEARELVGLYLLNERLIVHTAHEFRTCFEHFLRMLQLVESNPEFDARVARVRRAAGEQSIELKNGCRLRFLARSGASGRGLSGDCVILDEAFALTPPMMGALLPTLSARPNPQVWYTSSAPKATSDVLHAIRARGRSGEGGRLFYAEWAADADVDPADRDAWYATNPALGIRIAEDFVAGELDAMRAMPEEFARERLGVAEELVMPGGAGPIDLDAWDLLVDARSSLDGRPVLALDVNPELKYATIAAAGRRSDGLFHVEVVDRRPGTSWVVDACREICTAQRVALRVAPSSPAGSFIARLREVGVEVDQVGDREHAQACVGLMDAVMTGALRHLGGAAMTNAIACARMKPSGDSWVWSRARSSADISALVAVTLALGGVPEVSSYAAPFVDLDDY